MIVVMTMINIHFDFTDGSELSYEEGMEAEKDFNTNCLAFFSFDVKDDVKVIKKDGSYILKSELLGTSDYTDREIRLAHNIEKILRANGFCWKK